VCGDCALERHWVRSLEHTLSVQDVIRLIKCGITKKEDAARLCNIGLNVIDHETAAELQTLQHNQDGKGEGRPRSEMTEMLTKKYAKAGRRSHVTAYQREVTAPVVVDGIGSVEPAKPTSTKATEDTQAAVTKAVMSAGLGSKGKRKSAPETARNKLKKRLADMEKRPAGGARQASGAVYDI